MKPKISVIVPMFNAAPYIKRCVESLLCQTFQNFELILVDDGSQDDTYAICEQLRLTDSRIVIISQPNQGASAARNRGIVRAKGTWLCFVDADDMVSPVYLQELIACTDKDTDLVIQGMTRLQQSGETIDRGMHVDGRFVLPEQAEQLFGVINIERFGGPVCKLFRREIVERHHLMFNTNVYLAEDLDFLLRYLCSGRNVVLSAKNNYYYNEITGSASSRLYSFDKELNGLLALTASWNDVCLLYQSDKLNSIRKRSFAYYYYRCLFAASKPNGTLIRILHNIRCLPSEHKYYFVRYWQATTLYLKVIKFSIACHLNIFASILLFGANKHSTCK